MKEVEKIIDINAHIEHLSWTIITEGEAAIVKISFDNLGFGDITAIKFNACGYNAFGDIVPVNGRDKFFLIIQDFRVNKNEKATDLKVKIPNAYIKKLDLTESQICYADGTVLTYEGENSVTFDLEEFNESSEELMALRKIYDPKVKYVPKDFENGWICTCGRFNFLDKSQCSLCGNFKTGTISVCSDSNRKKIIEDYRKQKEQERENQIAENKRKEKESLKKKIYIAAGAVIALFFIIFCAEQSKLSKREIYSSVNEMRSDMQGNWSHYGYSGYDVLWQIQIAGDKARQVFSSDDYEPYERTVKWNPSKGTFTIGSDTFIVKKGGRKLQEGNYEYEKGGYMSKSDSDSSYSSSSYESAYTALEITTELCYSSGSYTVCRGKVTNNGEKTYKFVEVKGSFKDSSGTVLDTDSTYAVGSEGLEPGESSSFRLSVDKDSKIYYCSVSLLDYD